MLSADISRQMKIILNLAMREVPYSSSPPLRTLPVPGAASEFFWLVLPLVSASDVKFSKAAMTNSVFFSFGRRSGCSCPAAGLQQGLCLQASGACWNPTPGPGPQEPNVYGLLGKSPVCPRGAGGLFRPFQPWILEQIADLRNLLELWVSHASLRHWQSASVPVPAAPRRTHQMFPQQI